MITILFNSLFIISCHIFEYFKTNAIEDEIFKLKMNTGPIQIVRELKAIVVRCRDQKYLEVLRLLVCFRSKVYNFVVENFSFRVLKKIKG
jgi:hypothetical protein